MRHARARGVWSTMLCCCAALGAVSPASGAELQELRLRLGAPTGAGDVDGGAVAVTISPQRAPRWLRWIGDDMHIEAAASFWSDASPDGDVYTTHVGPAWRFRPGILGTRGFLEAGTSVAWVSEQQVEGSDLGSLWHFTSHATLGVLLGPERNWHVGLRVRHSSNAGFESPNPGLDIVMLELGYHFGQR